MCSSVTHRRGRPGVQGQPLTQPQLLDKIRSSSRSFPATELRGAWNTQGPVKNNKNPKEKTFPGRFTGVLWLQGPLPSLPLAPLPGAVVLTAGPGT